MFDSLSLTAITFTSILMTSLVAGDAEFVEKALCESYPQLRVCALRYDIDQIMQEVVYLAHIAEQQHPQLFAVHSNDGSLSDREKRKSAFVRFGKRSSAVVDDSSVEPQQPVDLVINSRPARKSTYVRFG